MNEHDILLIRELTVSYEQQFLWYNQLRDLVQKILSRLILSRGDLNELMSGLEKKTKLMQYIENERIRTSDYVAQWQELKMRVAPCTETAELNAVLEKTTNAIKGFLDEEEKLKKYLEGIVRKETAGKQ